MVGAKQYRKLVPAVIVISASVWGCSAPSGPRPCPPTHARSRSSRAATRSTSPRPDGTIFVYDRSNKKMVYSGRLAQGNTVEMDPKRNNMRMDGRVVMERLMRDLHEY